jgi:hypothetical protein
MDKAIQLIEFNVEEQRAYQVNEIYIILPR